MTAIDREDDMRIVPLSALPAPVVTEEMVERAADAIQARRQYGNADRRTALADARAALSSALTLEGGEE